MQFIVILLVIITLYLGHMGKTTIEYNEKYI